MFLLPSDFGRQCSVMFVFAGALISDARPVTSSSCFVVLGQLVETQFGLA